MSTRMVPPGRTSSSQRGAVNPSGGNHFASCFGSVHALYTTWRGASKTRLMVRVRSAGMLTWLLVSLVTSLVLPLQFAQVFVQAIEAVLPELAIPLDPVGGLLEALRLEPAGPPLRIAAARDEAGALEDFQVLRDGRKRHVEGPGQLGDGGLTFREPRQDRAPGRIGERSERNAQVVRGHLSSAPSG